MYNKIKHRLHVCLEVCGALLPAAALGVPHSALPPRLAHVVVDLDEVLLVAHLPDVGVMEDYYS